MTYNSVLYVIIDATVHYHLHCREAPLIQHTIGKHDLVVTDYQLYCLLTCSSCKAHRHTTYPNHVFVGLYFLNKCCMQNNGAEPVLLYRHSHWLMMLLQ